MATLADTPRGAQIVVCGLRGGHEFVSRLAALGLVAGTPVEVLQNRGRGPLLIRVRETRIALGRGEAAQVLVDAAS